jgi:hypothetical protein
MPAFASRGFRKPTSSDVSAAPWLKPNTPSNGGLCRNSETSQSFVFGHPSYRIVERPRPACFVSPLSLDTACHQPKSPIAKDGASTHTNSASGSNPCVIGRICICSVFALP